MNKKNIINLLILLGKILAPVGKVLVKLLKAAKVVKVALIGGSFAAYAYMFSWKFAVLILVFLFVHEYGHIWAMKRCGMKTKGIYFVPFLGAAAVTDQQFKSYKDEVYIALMGPVWGIALALAGWCAYGMTGKVIFIGAAIWMFLVTLFNLLPIMPLDGGRVVRSVAMSLSSWGGVIIFALGFSILIFLSKVIGAALIIFFLVIGGIETFGEMLVCYLKKRHTMKELNELTESFKKQMTKAWENHSDWVEAKLGKTPDLNSNLIFNLKVNFYEMYEYYKGNHDNIMVPDLLLQTPLSPEENDSAKQLYLAIKNSVEGFKFRESLNMFSVEEQRKIVFTFYMTHTEEKEFERKNLRRDRMTKNEILLSAAGLLIVAGISLALMFEFKNIPGAEMALDILRSK
jgi:Zn-dependent protease